MFINAWAAGHVSLTSSQYFPVDAGDDEVDQTAYSRSPSNLGAMNSCESALTDSDHRYIVSSVTQQHWSTYLYSQTKTHAHMASTFCPQLRFMVEQLIGVHVVALSPHLRGILPHHGSYCWHHVSINKHLFFNICRDLILNCVLYRHVAMTHTQEREAAWVSHMLTPRCQRIIPSAAGEVPLHLILGWLTHGKRGFRLPLALTDTHFCCQYTLKYA